MKWLPGGWGQRTRGHRILMYHRVLADATPAFVVDALSGEVVTQSVFAQQLAWVQRKYSVLSLTDFLARVAHARTPLATITFDDGMADNASYALPVLQKLNVSATVFVVAGHIGQAQGFLHHRLARWASQATHPLLEQMRTQKNRPRQQLDFLQQAVANMAPDARAEFLATHLTSQDSSADRFLDESELKQLMAGGISLQSHTLSHRRLAELGKAEQRREIQDSKAVLEALTGRPVNYFAYPVGRREDFTPDTTKLVREAGYTAAFSAEPGLIDARSETFALPRIGPRNSLVRLRKQFAA